MLKEATEPVRRARVGRPPLPRDADGNVIRTGEKGKSKKPKKKASAAEKKEGLLCCCCGSFFHKVEDNFLKSNSVLFDGSLGYVPVCKLCLKKYYETMVLPAFDEDPYRATEYICGLFDWFYDKRVVDVALRIELAHQRKGSRMPMIIVYGQRKNMKQYTMTGSTYLEKCKQDWDRQRTIRVETGLEEEAEVLKVHEEPASAEDLQEDEDGLTPTHPDYISKEDRLLFGPGYMPEEYAYLREQYEDWTRRYDCQTKAQEEIYKNLAIAQVNLRRAQLEGDQKRTNEAIQTLNNLMDSAKIKPKQREDPALVEQNTFGTLIQKWENEEPIPEPSEEWKDVDGIKKYLSVWFYGHLCKMFGLDNDNAKEYEEELAKYTVDPPQYQREEETDADGEITQKIKAMRGKGVQEPETLEEGG